LTLRKAVLITGCSSGFGKATAQLFVDKGWNVIATMRRPGDNGIEGPADRLRVVALDVTDAKSIKAAISEATGLFGGVDVLVNNAGIGLFSPLETTSDETIRRLFETNAFGVMAMVRAIVPHMRERGSGTIVNVTSSVTFNPMPMVAVYAASKIAVDGLSEALYYELAPFGIDVKMVEPGYGPGTKFQSSMMALNDENSFPAPYKEQLGVLMGSIPKLSTNNKDVADAVFKAVNDTSPSLRFPAGADAVAIAGKRAELSEEAFLGMMRQVFRLQQQ
jgi:NAD(P)-dependent dehydrogenase (short-subunit alcohol dehydrogenase family)